MSNVTGSFQVWGHHKRRRQWEHLYYEFDGSSQRLLYVDGVEVRRQKVLYDDPVTIVTGCTVRMPKGYDKFRVSAQLEVNPAPGGPR